MTEPSATALPGTAPAPPARLEPDAIGVAQDTVIGMATSAPAAVVAITLAALAATANYGGGPVLLISAIPMLIIANAYRRLNMWNANAGASFEWVGRSINPYLGFLTGWLMIAGYVLGTLSGVEVLGPSVLAVFDASSTSVWANVAIATAVGLLMLVIAVVGIRITARTQVAMAVVEYTILVGMSIWGLIFVLGHHAGTVPDHQGLVQPHRDRRAGQPGGRVPHRGVRLQRLGRDDLRQRGGQAPPGQPGPGRPHRRRTARGHLHARPGGLQGVVSSKNLQANTSTRSCTSRRHSAAAAGRR